MNKLFSKLVATVIIAALLIYLVPMIMPAIKAQPVAPSYYITPATEALTTTSPPPGGQFTVTVVAAAVNGTDSWSVDVGFNNTQLSVVKTTIVSTNTTLAGLFVGHSTTPLGPIISTSDILASETLLGQDYIPANTGPILTITFQTNETPGPGQTLTSLIDPAFGLPPTGETLYILQSPTTDFPTAEIDNPNTAPCTYSFSSGGITPPTKADITFTQTGLDGSASGTVVTINGTALTYAQLPNVTSVNSTDTLVFSYEDNVSSTTSGEQFAKTGVNATSPLTVSTSETITGSYKTQYQVSLAVSPSGAGTTNPSGTNLWEDSGSLSISATPNSGFAFSNWTTTGSITVTSSTSASTTANVSGTGTITANFVSGTGGNPLYDIIGDGKVDVVDIKDIHAAASAFGSTPNLPNWNPRADVNHDGKIDIVDIYMIAAHFGQLD